MSNDLAAKNDYLLSDMTISELVSDLQAVDWDDMESIAHIASTLCYHSEYMARFLTLACGGGWSITACVDAAGSTAYCVNIPRHGDMPVISATNPKLTLALAMAMVNVAVAHMSMKNDEFGHAVASADESDASDDDDDDEENG